MDGFDACVVDQHRVENDYSPGRWMRSEVWVHIMPWKYPHRGRFYIFGEFTLSGRPPPWRCTAAAPAKAASSKGPPVRRCRPTGPGPSRI